MEHLSIPTDSINTTQIHQIILQQHMTSNRTIWSVRIRNYNKNNICILANENNTSSPIKFHKVQKLSGSKALLFILTTIQAAIFISTHALFTLVQLSANKSHQQVTRANRYDKNSVSGRIGQQIRVNCRSSFCGHVRVSLPFCRL